MFYSLGPLDARRADKTAVAQNGQFAAISLDTVEQKKHFFTEPSSRLTAMQIAVYDLTLKKRVLTVDVAPLPKNDYDFALSPDGSKLAVLNDRKVSVYTVPVEPAEHTEKVGPKDSTLRLQVPVRATKPNQ
jgi:hypothetical protein